MTAETAVDESKPDEFLVFKKNAQHLYATLFVFELPWPSPTVQWFPELVADAKTDKPRSTQQRLLLATSTGGQADEFIRVAEISIPTILPYMLGDVDEKLEVGGYNSQLAADLRIVQRIFVEGTVLRARYMPQNCNVVATVSTLGLAAVFDATKFPYVPIADYVPTISLIGHESSECVCLTWSPAREGHLASGDNAGLVLVWDIKGNYDYKTGRMDPQCSIKLNKNAEINDIQFHPRRADVLAFVADDNCLYLYNVHGTKPVLILSHEFDSAPTSLAWNPVNDSLMAVGFSDGSIVLLDLRTDVVELFAFNSAHESLVTAISWNTWHPSVFASASADSTVKVWNAAGFEQSPLFVHSGHCAPVTDVNWNPATPSMLASVAEDNGLHIYEASNDLIGF